METLVQRFPDGTKNPWKHYKPHPADSGRVVYKHPQTGKNIVKPKPPGFGNQSGYVSPAMLRWLTGWTALFYPSPLACGLLDCDGDGISDHLQEEDKSCP